MPAAPNRSANRTAAPRSSPAKSTSVARAPWRSMQWARPNDESSRVRAWAVVRARMCGSSSVVTNWRTAAAVRSVMTMSKTSFKAAVPSIRTLFRGRGRMAPRPPAGLMGGEG